MAREQAEEFYKLLPKSARVRLPSGEIEVKVEPFVEDLDDNDRGEPIAQWEVYADLWRYRGILRYVDAVDVDGREYSIGSISNHGAMAPGVDDPLRPWRCTPDAEFDATGRFARFLGEEDEIQARYRVNCYATPAEALAALLALFEELVAKLPPLLGTAHTIDEWPPDCERDATQVSLVTVEDGDDVQLMCVHDDEDRVARADEMSDARLEELATMLRMSAPGSAWSVDVVAELYTEVARFRRLKERIKK